MSSGAFFLLICVIFTTAHLHTFTQCYTSKHTKITHRLHTMASISKLSNGHFRASVFKLGQRKTKVFDLKSQAVAWAAQVEAEIVAGKSGEVPNKTFGDLLSEYSRRVSPTKKGARWEQIRIELFKRDPIAEVRLPDLSKIDFANWRDRRLTQVSAGSVIREWNLLSSAINTAIREWGWLKDSPIKDVRRPAAPESRDRLISPGEIDRLLHVLGDNPETITGRVGLAFQFAIETAMRAGEICSLTWDRVYLDRKFCTVSDGKTQAARRDVPLSPRAIELLKILLQLGRPLVFDLKTSQIDALFRKAKVKAMVDDLHFHDTRHQAITNLAKKLDVLDLARMVGHRDLKMLSVYYNETAESMANKL